MIQLLNNGRCLLSNNQTVSDILLGIRQQNFENDNIWNNIYLNKYSFISLGTMLSVPAIGTSMSLLLVGNNVLLIVSISAIISNAFCLKLSRFRSSRHVCSSLYSGSSKQEVMMSWIWSLSWPTLIMRSSSSSSSLSVLSKKASDLMKILWHASSRRKAFFFNRLNN